MIDTLIDQMCVHPDHSATGPASLYCILGRAFFIFLMILASALLTG